MALFILLFVFLDVEKSVGPLAPKCEVHLLPIRSLGGSANVSGQNASSPQKPNVKMSTRKQQSLLTNANLTLTKKLESQRNVSAVSVQQQSVSEEQKLCPVVHQMPTGAFVEFSLPLEKHENSLGQYLAELSNFYHSANLPIPPVTIARVLLRLKNELDFHWLKNGGLAQPTVAKRLPYPLSLENFRAEKQTHDPNGMGGNIRLTFVDECKICSKSDLTVGKLGTMSPQQISEMRLSSDKSDIVWFLGSVIHLLAFKMYPLEHWLRLRDETFPTHCQIGANLNWPQNSDSFCVFLVRNEVNKMLVSAERLQMRSDFPRGFGKEYAVLGQIMENALLTDADKRTFDRNGQLLKLASTV